MTDATPRHARGNPRLRRAALGTALAVAVAGAVLVGVAVDHQHTHDAAVSHAAARREQIDQRAAQEAERPRQYHGTTTSAPPAATVSSIDGSGATLVVPALGVRAPIVAEGATDGSMTIPSDISTVGWYDGMDASAGPDPGTHSAPWPGQPGVAVLAGHVDWAGEGPGALYYLDQLEPGDPIEVVGSNGVTTRWQVSEAPITTSKSTLPPTLFVNTGTPKLALVTCGGPFDASTGHYLDNVIVWATPASGG